MGKSSFKGIGSSQDQSGVLIASKCHLATLDVTEMPNKRFDVKFGIRHVTFRLAVTSQPSPRQMSCQHTQETDNLYKLNSFFVFQETCRCQASNHYHKRLIKPGIVQLKQT